MLHLVRYTMPGGQQEHREAPSLEAAAELVEKARNELGATDAQIFREVPIEFKVQYKVSVAGESAPAPEVSAAPAPPATPPAPTTPPSAAPAEPPPGAMPLSARPAGEDAPPSAESDEAPENVTSISGDAASRRTLFGRS